MLALTQTPGVEAALVVMHADTGHVKALVGGYDFRRSQFNRVTQALRQPGSAFKPLIYGAALSLADDDQLRRFTPASIVYDRPKVYTDSETDEDDVNLVFTMRPERWRTVDYAKLAG